MTAFSHLLNAPAASAVTARDCAIGLALAFLLGQLAAWTYIYTHTGVSYSKAFVQSIIALTLIVTIAMMIIGNNIIVAFGLLGALSMIRFRNVLKDTRDTAFVFFAVVTGIACGTGCRGLAVAGSGLFCLLFVYLYLTAFGNRRDSDAFLRFNAEIGVWDSGEIQTLLHRHCFATDMITQRIGENGHMELAFQLAMRDPESGHALVESLQKKEGLSAVTFLRQAQEDEV
ncbi:MAG TPA: DUF4956 domain-containing protein [Candidatus Hydrogenedentes bacterium]|nr:DUF4956 domain-containing protein [Candidatus Hydrogenedentota bacterium]